MFKITKYEFPSKKELVIAHFSDIHYSAKFNLKKFEIIEKKLQELKPDYICITGDLIDNLGVTQSSEINNLFSFLERISKIALVLIALGNHDIRDYKGLKDNNWYDKLKNRVIVLKNQSYGDDNIYFYGLSFENDYYQHEHDFIDALSSKLSEIHLSKDKYNILLFHSPTNFSDKKVALQNKFDLVLTGHTHNGLTPHFIPGNFGFIQADHGLFAKIARNSFKCGNSEVIISGGITKLSEGTHLRFFDKFYANDLVYIYLKKDEKN